MAAQDPQHTGSQVNDAALLRRIADTVAIMLYEMEVLPDGSFHCHEFVGLETLIGPVPDGMTPDDAYSAAVHPDDRAAYDAASAALDEGRPVEVEYRLIASDGSVRWVLDRMRPRTSSDGRVLVGGVVADITDRKQTEVALGEANRKRAELELRETQRLAHIALHDSLTGLPNRIAIQEHLAQALKRAERSGASVALMFIDLDNFKLINDSFGHAAGDQLLQAVGARLREAVRDSDLVARQGGDEFLILLPDLPRREGGSPELSASPAEGVAQKVRDALRSPFSVEGIETFISASIGISLYPDHAADAMTLIKHADFAMYMVKESGRDGHALYARAVDTGLEEISRANRLRKALEDGRGLVLHYQPIVTLESREVVGVEALVRWEDGARGLVAPAELIPLAERMGMLTKLTERVIEEACLQAARWHGRGRDLFVSINVPPSYCREAGLDHLLAAARRAGVDPGRLMIEVTESALSPCEEQEMECALADTSRQGLRLAIDEFGTGYSSLGRLNAGWASMLKVDRSFVSNLTTDPRARRLLGAMGQLARALELIPIAVGVETAAQRDVLLAAGFTLGQGFLISRPLPRGELEAFLDHASQRRHAA